MTTAVKQYRSFDDDEDRYPESVDTVSIQKEPLGMSMGMSTMTTNQLIEASGAAKGKGMTGVTLDDVQFYFDMKMMAGHDPDEAKDETVDYFGLNNGDVEVNKLNTVTVKGLEPINSKDSSEFEQFMKPQPGQEDEQIAGAGPKPDSQGVSLPPDDEGEPVTQGEVPASGKASSNGPGNNTSNDDYDPDAYYSKISGAGKNESVSVQEEYAAIYMCGGMSSEEMKHAFRNFTETGRPWKDYNGVEWFKTTGGTWAPRGFQKADEGIFGKIAHHIGAAAGKAYRAVANAALPHVNTDPFGVTKHRTTSNDGAGAASAEKKPTPPQTHVKPVQKKPEAESGQNYHTRMEKLHAQQAGIHHMHAERLAHKAAHATGRKREIYHRQAEVHRRKEGFHAARAVNSFRRASTGAPAWKRRVRITQRHVREAYVAYDGSIGLGMNMVLVTDLTPFDNAMSRYIGEPTTENRDLWEKEAMLLACGTEKKEADAKKGETLWTISKETGKQHRWEVKVPTRHNGLTLAKNLDTGIQRDLKPGEWHRNPADFEPDETDEVTLSGGVSGFSATNLFAAKQNDKKRKDAIKKVFTGKKETEEAFEELDIETTEEDAEFIRANAAGIDEQAETIADLEGFALHLFDLLPRNDTVSEAKLEDPDISKYVVSRKSVMIGNIWWTVTKRDMDAGKLELTTSDWAVKDGHKRETKSITIADLKNKVNSGKWGVTIPGKGRIGAEQDKSQRAEQRKKAGIRKAPGTPKATESITGSPAYKAAWKAHADSFAKFKEARDKYRAKKIGDKEFLAATKAHEEESKKFDAVAEKEPATDEDIHDTTEENEAIAHKAEHEFHKKEAESSKPGSAVQRYHVFAAAAHLASHAAYRGTGTHEAARLAHAVARHHAENAGLNFAGAHRSIEKKHTDAASKKESIEEKDKKRKHNGGKHTCASCGMVYYTSGTSSPRCPRCGENDSDEKADNEPVTTQDSAGETGGEESSTESVKAKCVHCGEMNLASNVSGDLKCQHCGKTVDNDDDHDMDADADTNPTETEAAWTTPDTVTVEGVRTDPAYKQTSGFTFPDQSLQHANWTAVMGAFDKANPELVKSVLKNEGFTEDELRKIYAKLCSESVRKEFTFEAWRDKFFKQTTNPLDESEGGAGSVDTVSIVTLLNERDDYVKSYGGAIPQQEKSGEAYEPLTRQYTQYIKKGNTYQPSGEVILKEALAPCPYRVKMTMWGPEFERIKHETDKLIRFKDAATETILEEIDKFWNRKEAFENLGLMHTRGVMVYGPPGSGKSCGIQHVVEMMIQRGDVVLYVNSVTEAREGLRAFRSVEPDRKVVVVMEEAEMVAEYDERGLLRLLDGDDKINNVLYLATTNHIDRISERILRPGRFDKHILVHQPCEAARLAYFTAKLAKLSEKDTGDLKTLAKKTEGLSFGGMRELIVGAFAMGEPIDDVLARLREPMGEKAKRLYGTRNESVSEAKIADLIESEQWETFRAFLDEAGKKLSIEALYKKAKALAQKAGDDYMKENPDEPKSDPRNKWTYNASLASHRAFNKACRDLKIPSQPLLPKSESEDWTPPDDPNDPTGGKPVKTPAQALESINAAVLAAEAGDKDAVARILVSEAVEEPDEIFWDALTVLCGGGVIEQVRKDYAAGKIGMPKLVFPAKEGVTAPKQMQGLDEGIGAVTDKLGNLFWDCMAEMYGVDTVSSIRAKREGMTTVSMNESKGKEGSEPPEYLKKHLEDQTFGNGGSPSILKYKKHPNFHVALSFHPGLKPHGESKGVRPAWQVTKMRDTKDYSNGLGSGKEATFHDETQFTDKAKAEKEFDKWSKAEPIHVTAGSHRAYSGIERAIGHKPQSFYHMKSARQWIEVTPEEHEKIKDITGVKKSKIPDGARKTWSDKTETTEASAVSMNFEQWCAKHGVNSTPLDHSTLSPNGRVSKRSRDAADKRLDTGMAGLAKAQNDYRKEINAGTIVDPTGKYKKEAPEEDPRVKKVHYMRQRATELLRLANLGMSKGKFTKEANKVNAEADALEKAMKGEGGATTEGLSAKGEQLAKTKSMIARFPKGQEGSWILPDGCDKGVLTTGNTVRESNKVPTWIMAFVNESGRFDSMLKAGWKEIYKHTLPGGHAVNVLKVDDKLLGTSYVAVDELGNVIFDPLDYSDEDEIMSQVKSLKSLPRQSAQSTRKASMQSDKLFAQLKAVPRHKKTPVHSMAAAESWTNPDSFSEAS